LWNTTLFGELAVADGVRNVAVNWNRPTLSLFATKALIAKVMLFGESQETVAAYGNAQKIARIGFRIVKDGVFVAL